MDAHIEALEVFVAAFSDTLESKLSIFFDQFHREMAFSGGGVGSPSARAPVASNVSLDSVYHGKVKFHRSSRRDLYDGGPSSHRQQWQPRIEFPRFILGEDPLAWIYHAEQFFAYYSTPEHQKVITISFQLDDKALQWFRWQDCLLTTPHWEDFIRALCCKFGPFEFEDSAEALFKLCQSGTLKDYISEFHHLANRTPNLGPILLKSCFLGGLRKELKYDVKLLRPNTVHDAIAIAIQLDTKFTNLKGRLSKPSPPFRSYTPNPINFLVKRLTPEEIQKKWEIGECWFCDEKWTRVRRCIHKQLLMLDLVSVDEGEVEPPLADNLPEIQHMELSECAFYSTNAKHTV